MEVAQKTAKTVLVVLMINMFSRALALIANSMTTAFYGATAQTSAYSFSIVITNTVTTVIGTALTTAVIPIFIELTENYGKERAHKFINDTISLTVVMGLLLTVIGAAAAPYIASGVKEGSFEFAVYSIRLMLPAIIFISLFFVFSGVLQASGRFYMPAMVSIPSSLVNMLYIFTMSSLFGMKGLVAATLTGFGMQALILVPAMLKAGFVFKFSFDYKSEDIKRIFALTGPVIIGVCAYQINLLTNSSIAISYNSDKYVVLNNMQNLGIQIILTLIYAITSVMYPKLAAYAASKDMDGFRKNLSLIVKAVVLILLPVTIGFILLSGPMVDIIYGYKKFGAQDVKMGAEIFSLYAIGIIGIGFKEIIDRAFYSIKNTKIPAFNGVFIMIVNIVLSLILVQYMGLRGISLAYSIAALAGGAVLILLVQRKIGSIGLDNIVVTVLKSSGACVVMGFAVIAVGQALQHIGLDSSKMGRFAALMIQSGVGAAVYGIGLYLLRVQEFAGVMNSVIKFKK